MDRGVTLSCTATPGGGFSPPDLDIYPGDAVQWRTASGASLSKPVRPKLFIDPSGDGKHVFTDPGIYAYFLDRVLILLAQFGCWMLITMKMLE